MQSISLEVQIVEYKTALTFIEHFFFLQKFLFLFLIIYIYILGKSFVKCRGYTKIFDEGYGNSWADFIPSQESFAGLVNSILDIMNPSFSLV